MSVNIPALDIKDIEKISEDLGVKGQEITSAPLVIPEIDDSVPVREGRFAKILREFSKPEEPSLSLKTKVMMRPGLAIGGLLPLTSQLETSAFKQYYD